MKDSCLTIHRRRQRISASLFGAICLFWEARPCALVKPFCDILRFSFVPDGYRVLIPVETESRQRPWQLLQGCQLHILQSTYLEFLHTFLCILCPKSVHRVCAQLFSCILSFFAGLTGTAVHPITQWMRQV